MGQQTSGKATTPSKIVGVAKDAKTGEPVPYATAALYAAGSETNIAGAVADGNGKFFITGMELGTYDLKLSFLGYETITVDGIQIVSKTGDVNVGEIKMTDEGLALEEVTVQGQRDLIEERVDRTIYKAENDKTTAGGDGTDVLRRVPMLSVDLDGNVSMRGSSNITVLIDGRPSAIAASSITDALKQIPADEIKEVEVITSPSAKYDAEGTSGVINIITKKNNLQGMSANIRTGTGLRGSDFGLNASARKGKFGFTLGGFGRAGYNINGSNVNSQKFFNDDNSVSKTLQTADTKSNNLFGRYNFGVDYEIDKYNFITGAVNFGIRNRTNSEDNLLVQNFRDDILTSTQLRETDIKDNSNSIDVSLNYTKTFEKKGKEIALLTLYSRNNGENSNINTILSEDMSSVDYRLKNDNPNKNEEFTIQLDLIEPLGKDGKSILEYGAKNILRKVYSDFAYFRAEGATGEYVENPDPELSNGFNYDQNVTAGYVSYTATIFKNYTIKPGIRYEYTTISADFEKETAPVDIPSYGTFVPSLNLSRSLANGNMIKASYNRRISRPSLRYLNPNLDKSNLNQWVQGNPVLDPEYTDNYELGYSTFFKSTMVSFSGFFRNTTGSIQPIRTPQENNVIFTTYDNIGHERAYGTNIFTNISVGSKFSLNGSVDAYYAFLDNGLTDPDFAASNEGFVISGRLFGNYTLPNDWQIQAFTFARGRQVQLQGSSGGFYMYGLGLNKQFDEKRGTIGFGADNFLTKEFKMKNEIITSSIVQNSTNIMRNMNFKINFSYRIGKLSVDQKPRRKKSISNDDLKGGGESNGAEMQQNK